VQALRTCHVDIELIQLASIFAEDVEAFSTCTAAFARKTVLYGFAGKRLAKGPAKFFEELYPLPSS